jgi:uncharacterized membrane protein YkoI
MSRINSLGLEQAELLDRLYFLNPDDEDDDEAIYQLTQRLEQIRGSAAGTVEFLSVLLLESKAILEGREEVKRKAERRRKVAENATERLKGVILRIMQDFELKKVSGNVCDIRLQLSPGRLVYESTFKVDKLPLDCIEVIPEQHVPIDAKVKTMLKEGYEVEGAVIVKEWGMRVS